MLNETDEKQLVKDVLAGNKNAFIKLINQYEGLVLHIATPLIGINEDREDICQDVFIRVYEKLDTFQFKSKLSTWIGNIAYNICINFLKKKRNILLEDLVAKDKEFIITEEFQGSPNDPEQMMIKSENINYLNSMIDCLPEMQKSILLLFYQDELSLEEISNILEMPVNTVKSHLYRARSFLKVSLTKKMDNYE